MSEELGVKVKRSEDFSKWYLEVVRKGNFIDQRTPVKGCDVILPWGYALWERIHKSFDRLLKDNNVLNAYFPLLIPESLIKKEEEHLEGFKAETAVVTEVGNKKLDEKLAVRPTSETIMYKMFSLWIRSHKDLPLKINQWSNILRWDTKVTKPFIRGREFLWQEGHTAHATKDDAITWIDDVIEMYDKMYKLFSMAYLLLKRPKTDTFPGAEFSVVFDTLSQDGKIIQGPGIHMLGQNFSKPFGITFLDRNEKRNYVWQTSWGMSTRQIGILISHFGDDKGAVLPPALSPYEVVIIPILFKGKEKKIEDYTENVYNELKKMKIRAYLDGREYSAGFKFHDWELRGVPLRIEIGPKDIKEKSITIVRRIDGKKNKIPLKEVKKIEFILKDIQKEMLKISEKRLKQNIKDVSDLSLLKKMKNGIARVNWCGSVDCDSLIKSETGSEIRGSLYKKKEKTFGTCIACGKKAKEVVYLAKAY